MRSFLSSVKGKVIVIVSGVLVIAAAAVILLVLNSFKESYRNISISEIFGIVTAENSGKEYKAYKNMRLADGHALTTDRDSYSRMTLDDDKYVKLEEQSRVVFKGVGSDKSRRTALDLERGALVTEITKPLAADEDYVINTPNAVLAVRGTYFRVEVKFDTNGDAYTYVYTYGGAVACRRIMPDGTLVDEDVVVRAGYKACIKMDEIITVYLEEAIDEGTDNVDPIELNMISDNDLVDIYNSSMHGHELFRSSGELWNEIEQRGIDIKDYQSVYDGGDIPPYGEGSDMPDNSNESGGKSLPSQSDAESSSPFDSSNSSDSSNDTSGSSSSPEANDSDWNAPMPSNPDNTHVPSEDNNSRPSGGNNPGSGSGNWNSGSNNFGSTSEPSNSGSTSEPSNSGSTSEPNNSGGASEPNNSGSTSEPNNSGSTSEPNNSGGTSEPSNSGSTSEPSNSGGGGSGSHTHLFGDYFSDNNATCTSDGTKTAECHLCGKRSTIADVGSMLPHTEAERITQPTAETDGRRVVYCSVCGEILKEEVIPKLERTLYMEDGSILITETGYIQVVGGNISGIEETPYTGTYTISQRDSSKSLNYGIVLNADVPVKLDSVNIKGIGFMSASGTLTGTDKENTISQIATQGDNISVTLHDIKLNVVDNDTGGNGRIAADTLTLDNAVLNVIYPDVNLINVKVLNINSGALYVNGTTRDYCISANEINVNGGTLTVEDHGYFPIKYSVMNITGGRVHASVDGKASPWFCMLVDIPEINISGGFLWIWGSEQDVDLNITGGCVAFEENYSTVNKKVHNAEYSCTVYDTYPGNITVPRPDGTVYIYKMSPEDAAENGKYYVWLPVYPDGVTISAANFPDEKFREYVSSSFDKDGDGALSDAEIEDITIIQVSGTLSSDGGITSLKGIEFFTKLYVLECEYNSGLTSLDISKNKELYAMSCYNTQISALDVSSNTALEYLECYNCHLPFVNIINSSITHFLANDNVYPLPEGIGVVFDPNDDPNFDGFEPDRVSDVYGAVFENGKFTGFTGDVISYTYDCGYGFSAMFTLRRTGEFPGILINADNFPDETFRNYVSQTFDRNGDGKLSQEEMDEVTVIDVSGTHSNDGGVTSLKGIEVFSNLKTLLCEYNAGLTSLDVSHNKRLTILNCGKYTGLTSLDVSQNTELIDLDISITGISSIDLSQNTMLTSLDCGYTQISTLDLSRNTALAVLYCHGTQISSLDVSHNNALITLFCHTTPLASLDLSGCISLNELNCMTTRLTALDVNDCVALTKLICADSPIASLDLYNNLALQFLSCGGTQLTSLYLVPNIELMTLDCSNSPITRLELGNMPKLTTLECSFCRLPYVNIDADSIVSFKADNNIYYLPETVTTRFDTLSDPTFNLPFFYTNMSNIEGAIFENGVFSGFTGDTITYTYDCGEGYSETFTLKRTGELNGTYVAISEENFPDPVFREYIARNLDKDRDNLLSETEIEEATDIRVGGGGYEIYSLKGIELFTELKSLDCGFTRITTLDVSKNTKLVTLYCNCTQISSIDLSRNTELTNLWIYATNITSLDISSNTMLTEVDCNNTPLTSLDVSQNTLLMHLNIFNCRLPFIDISNNPSLSVLIVYPNVYPLPASVTTTFDTRTDPNFNGFDYSKVSDVGGATFSDGVFSNFTGDTISYTYDCGHGRSEMFTLTRTGELDGVAISAENFPDEKFREYIRSSFDKDSDGLLSEAEINAVTTINVVGITSLEGIEHFTKLARLLCANNSELTELDISNNTALTYLDCSNTGITSLDVSNNTALESLYCYNTGIAALDVRNNTALTGLSCFGSNLPFVDISNNPLISGLAASGNIYPLPASVTTFDTRTDPNFNGFDPYRATNVQNAVLDQATGVFSNITGDITYIYDCGQGISHSFTLKLP